MFFATPKLSRDRQGAVFKVAYASLFGSGSSGLGDAECEQ
jgi:hypothetical protein